MTVFRRGVTAFRLIAEMLELAEQLARKREGFLKPWFRVGDGSDEGRMVRSVLGEIGARLMLGLPWRNPAVTFGTLDPGDIILPDGTIVCVKTVDRDGPRVFYNVGQYEADRRRYGHDAVVLWGVVEGDVWRFLGWCEMDVVPTFEVYEKYAPAYAIPCGVLRDWIVADGLEDDVEAELACLYCGGACRPDEATVDGTYIHVRCPA